MYLSVSAIYVTTSMIILFQIIYILGRKKAIDKYLEKIKSSVDSIDDPNTLDWHWHTHYVLTQTGILTCNDANTHIHRVLLHYIYLVKHHTYL